MLLPRFVKIVEVGPRDGLQNESKIIPAETKIELINRLSETGLKVIEATSFVSPRWIPQLADSEKVYESIHKKKGVQYPVLIPNIKGLERAFTVNVKSIAVFTTPSELFSKKNTNCSVAESLKRISEIIMLAKKNHLQIRGYISCALGCPYEGEMPPEKVARIAKKLFELGCEEISLGDTIGTGTPIKTQQLIKIVAKEVPIKKLAVHFHDTYSCALANIFAAMQLGIQIVDASVGGLGGCPYAKGASGNVATEDVVNMLHEMKIETGVDLKKLITIGEFISRELNHSPRSKLSKVFK